MDTRLSGEFISEHSDIAHIRSCLYHIFSAAFRYPQDDIIFELSNEKGISLLDEIKEIYLVTPFTVKIINSFKEAVNSIKNLHELQAEYCRLFVGPFHLPAPPYESIYRAESKGRVMGDSTIHAKRMYLDEGLDVSAFIHDLPDHIVIELEFMSYLSEREAAACRNEAEKINYYIMKQNRFLDEHLIKWIPRFTMAVQEESRQEFYNALAKLTNIFIALEHDYVKAFMSSLNLRGQ